MKQPKGYHVDPTDEIVKIRKSEDDRAWESYQRYCANLNIIPLDQPEFNLMARYLHVFANWY